jgi:hypothetical protein
MISPKPLSLTMLIVGVLIACHGADKPYRMAHEDQLTGRAASAELDNMQRQFNDIAKQFSEAAKPKQMEFDGVKTKVCAAAKIDIADCVPNWVTGEVGHKPKEVPHSAPNSKP